MRRYYHGNRTAEPMTPVPKVRETKGISLDAKSAPNRKKIKPKLINPHKIHANAQNRKHCTEYWYLKPGQTGPSNTKLNKRDKIKITLV